MKLPTTELQGIGITMRQRITLMILHITGYLTHWGWSNIVCDANFNGHWSKKEVLRNERTLGRKISAPKTVDGYVFPDK